MDTTRPRPPDAILSLSQPDTFLPAPELDAWIKSAYMATDGALYWPGHKHLLSAEIRCLWTNQPYRKRGKEIAATVEIKGNQGGQSRWKHGRVIQQQREWWGFEPDFVMTVNAITASTMDDAAFCALIDHELCHCAQQEDEFGMPKFSRDTGKPLFRLRGHDVEEFVSVVERFGIEAAGESAVDLVVAAAKQPAIGPATVARACGNCLKLAA